MNKVDEKKIISDLFAQAKQAYEAHVEHQNVDKLLNYMITKGTLKDKLNALFKQICDHPSWSLKYIEQLLKSCKGHNRKETIEACKIMKAIFVDQILKEKAHLRNFSQRIDNEKDKKRKYNNFSVDQLRDIYLEHKIKYIYIDFVHLLQEFLQDNLYYIKKEALNILVELSQFQQLQSTIFQSLINKFGDGDLQLVNQLTKALRLRVGLNYQIMQCLLKQIQGFLFRKNISKHGQFYCINFLSNLNINFLHQKHLTGMLQLYFKLFKKIVIGDQTSLQQDLNSKLFLNVVKGLNKIFPVIKSQFKQFNKVFEEKVDYIYKIIHQTQNTKVKIQLFLFLFQSQNHIYHALSDRYYRCLYQFITQQSLISSSLLQLFFDLLLISVKQDQSIPRICAFVKRLLQTSLNANPPFIITSLIFLSKIMQTHNCIFTMIHKPERFLSDMMNDTEVNQQNKNKQYDIFKRQPLHSHADESCLWQISILVNHYHPTIRKFAQKLLQKQDYLLQYTGNPLVDFSITNFIEKLCLKSEKKSEGWKIKNIKNLSKMRPSKYDTLISKPLTQLAQDEQYLKDYLIKKKQLNSKKKRNMQQIQQFADQVIEKQMQRLNGKQDQDEQVQYSDQDIDQDQQILGDQQIDENFDEEDYPEEGNEFNQSGQMIDEDRQLDQLNQSQDNLDEEQVDEGYQDDQDDQQNQEDQQSEEKDFNDVFQGIGIDNMSKHKRDKKQLGKGKKNKKIKKTPKIKNSIKINAKKNGKKNNMGFKKKTKHL